MEPPPSIRAAPALDGDASSVDPAETKSNRAAEPPRKKRQTSQPDSAGPSGVGEELPPSGEAAPALRGDAPSADQVVTRPSSVRNISWGKDKHRWIVHVEKVARLYFPTRKWRSQGLDYEEAVAKALEEAKCALAKLRENMQQGKEAL